MKWKYDDHFVGITYEVLDDMKKLSSRRQADRSPTNGRIPQRGRQK